ncbi:MAG TPA: hypothetical protein VL346_07190 [Acidobacteriaceae bacterium]|nr:hypothetical protein [Acidobacteriaceae bacterium]
MKLIHTPRIDARYWTAITLASVFGTNLGDFYAHESGLGIVKGLAVLALLAAIAFLAERFDSLRHQAWYWLVIIFIRTGATNIADYLAFRVRIPGLLLTLGLAVLIALFGWGTHRAAQSAGPNALPPTNAAYWLAMLSAGVFGTVLGDICEHAFGEGVATIALTVFLLIMLSAGFRYAAQNLLIYWIIVSIARTAGTAIGDWFAENKILHIGLPLCTLGSGIVFTAILLFWRSSAKETAPALA